MSIGVYEGQKHQILPELKTKAVMISHLGCWKSNSGFLQD